MRLFLLPVAAYCQSSQKGHAQVIGVYHSPGSKTRLQHHASRCKVIGKRVAKDQRIFGAGANQINQPGEETSVIPLPAKFLACVAVENPMSTQGPRPARQVGRVQNLGRRTPAVADPLAVPRQEETPRAGTEEMQEAPMPFGIARK